MLKSAMAVGAGAVALLAMLPTLAQAAFTPNVFFNFTVEPYSPLLRYDPGIMNATFSNRSGETHSWVTSFDQSDLSTYAAGEIGMGPGHMQVYGPNDINAPNMPAMLVPWSGTGIYVWGTNYANATTRLTVPQGFQSDTTADVQNITAELSADGPLLASETGMEYEGRVSIVLVAGGMMTIDGVTLTLGIQDTNPNQTANFTELAGTVGATWSFVQNVALNPYFRFSGNWTRQARLGEEPAITIQRDYATGVENAYVVATIPANSTFLWLNGFVGPTYGVVTVDIKPVPPSMTSNSYLQYNPYYKPCTIFMTALDPTVAYTMTASAMSAGANTNYYRNSMISLESMSVLTLSNATTPTNGTTGGSDSSNSGTGKKSNIGPIVGGVVGGVGGAALLAILAFCWFRRRKAHRRTMGNEAPAFEIDDSAVTSPYTLAPEAKTPFRTSVSSAPMTSASGYSTISPQLLGYSEATSQPLSPTSGHSQFSSPMSDPNYPMSGHSSTSGPSESAATTAPYAALGTLGSRKSEYAPPPAQTQVPVPRRPHHSPMPRHFAQEQDGGTIPASDIELIPPSYNEEWAGPPGAARPVAVSPGTFTPGAPSPMAGAALTRPSSRGTTDGASFKTAEDDT